MIHQRRDMVSVVAIITHNADKSRYNGAMTVTLKAVCWNDWSEVSGDIRTVGDEGFLREKPFGAVPILRTVFHWWQEQSSGTEASIWTWHWQR